MKPMIPRENQEIAINLALKHKKALVALGLGQGKTLISVEVAKRAGVEVILIICPLNTRTSWARTLRQQGCASKIVRVDSKHKEERDALKKGEPGVYIIGREYFRRFKDWGTFKKIDMVINDECHGYANYKSVGFKSIRPLKAEYKLSLSGTPWGNKFENAWAVTRWLWPEQIPRGFWNWVEQWCARHTEEIWMKDPLTGAPKPKDVMVLDGEKSPGAFVKSLPCFIWFEEPEHPIIRDQLFVELTPAQRKMYDKFEKDSFVWLNEDDALIEDVPLVQRIRLMQIAMGTVALDDEGAVYFPENFKSAKLDALLEYIDLHPDENILILTKWSKYANIIADRLAGSRLWTGATKAHERDELIETFGTDFKYLIATTKALEAGVDGLQHNCNTMIWMDRANQDPTLHEQVEGRIARPTYNNEKKTVTCIDIIAEDTFDESILDRDYMKKKIVRSTLGYS